MATLSVKNLTRSALGRSRSVFEALTNTLLPTRDISLVLVGETRARALNQSLRNKSYVPNVLSYALGGSGGEVIICLSVARREAPRYGLSYRDFVVKLFIHGLLHIKGWAHGATMEACEDNLVAQVATGDIRSLNHVSTHRHGNRHRHLPGKGRRR